MSTPSGVEFGGSGGSSKVCVVCGEDVSSKPRTKDVKGRYYCQACYQRAIAAKQAKRESMPMPKAPPRASASHRAPAPPFDSRDEPQPNVLEGLLDLEPASGAAAHGKRCPGCGSAMASDAVICTFCGYNMQTGHRLTVEKVAAKEPGALSAGNAAGLLANPMIIALAILTGFGIFASTAWGNATPTMAYIAINSLFALGVAVTVLICAFREGVGQGLLTLCVPFYVLYFVYAVCDSVWIRWLFTASILSQLLGLALQMQVADELDQMGFSTPGSRF